MNLIETIESKVGIREPKPYLKKLYELEKMGTEQFTNTNCREYIRKVLTQVRTDWKPYHAFYRATESQYFHSNDKYKLKNIGRMRGLVNLMDRGDFNYAPHMTPEFSDREIYKTIATTIYLAQVKDHFFCSYKLEPQQFEVQQKFANGEWLIIDWSKIAKTNEFMNEDRVVNHPLYKRTISNSFDRILPSEIVKDGSSQQFKLHQMRNISMFARLNWISNTFHFIHVSVQDPSQIAYYPTLRDLREGREVRTKLGRYLNKYKEFFGITEDEVKKISDTYLAEIRSRQGWKVDYRGECDPDGWWESYYGDSQVNSCMVNDYCEEGIKTYTHPKSDLRLYYLYKAHGTDKYRTTIARAITRGKKYVRVYPDPNSVAEGQYLKNWLESNGFELDRECLDGALLLPTRHEEYPSEFYVPYVDGEYQSADLITIDYSDPTDFMYGNSIEYLQICSGGQYELDRTNGHTGEDDDEEDHGYCADCDAREHFDNLRYIDRIGDVCDHCIDMNYIWVECEEEYYRDDDVIRCESDSEYYPLDNYEDHDIHMDEYLGAYYHIDDMKKVQGHDGQVYHYHEDNCVQLLMPCSLGYEWAFYKDAIELPDGDLIHINDLVKFGYIKEEK